MHASATLQNEAHLQKLVGILIKESQWFAVTPLPDDRWQVQVKSENRERLLGWVLLIENLT